VLAVSKLAASVKHHARDTSTFVLRTEIWEKNGK